MGKESEQTAHNLQSVMSPFERIVDCMDGKTNGVFSKGFLVWPLGSRTDTKSRPVAMVPPLQHQPTAEQCVTPAAISQLECRVEEDEDVKGAIKHRDDYQYCKDDFNIQLETSCSLTNGGYFYDGFSSAEAKHILKSCEVGTYLLRNSSDPNYLYTISVKTKRGPTSIRIIYEKGWFVLDADEKTRTQMPKFKSLLGLVDYYVRLTVSKRADQCRFLDKSGRKDLPVFLQTPRLHSVPTLKHLCRQTVNRSLQTTSSCGVQALVPKLNLPPPLATYIKEYPYLN